jgi:hypothetical protein
MYLWLYYPFVGPWPLFQFLNPIHCRYDSLDGNQLVARPLSTRRTTQTRNKRAQTSMSWVEFEPKIPAFERSKTVHALDREATVIGRILTYNICQFPQESHGVSLPGGNLLWIDKYKTAVRLTTTPTLLFVKLITEKWILHWFFSTFIGV